MVEAPKNELKIPLTYELDGQRYNYNWATTGQQQAIEQRDKLTDHGWKAVVVPVVGADGRTYHTVYSR